jgi:hypothetical protein
MTLKKDREKMLKELKRKPQKMKMNQMMIKIPKRNHHIKVTMRISHKKRKRKSHKLQFQKVLLRFLKKWQ